MPFTFIKTRGMLPNGSHTTNQQLLKAFLTYIPVNHSKQCGRMAMSNAFHIYKDMWNAAKSFSYGDTVNVPIVVTGKVNPFIFWPQLLVHLVQSVLYKATCVYNGQKMLILWQPL